MDVQELLVATQGHLVRAHDRARAVVLPSSENAAAVTELRRVRVDLEHVHAYLWGARVLTEELSAGARGGQWTGSRSDVDLVGRHCVMVEEMAAAAARHLRSAREAVGVDATAGFATGVDAVQHALDDIVSGARAAARAAHELTRDHAVAPVSPAVRRMRSGQREHCDSAAPHLAGPRR